MHYLIIDTCVWIDMLQADTKNFETLNYWAQNQYIHIIVPSIVVDEWNRLKEEKIIKLKLEQKRTKNKHTKEVLKDIDIHIEDLIDRIDSSSAKNAKEEVQEVDNLLKEKTTVIEITDEIHSKASKWVYDRKAPSSDRKNSMPDTLIILSSLQYIENNNLQNCYFVSSNKADFSSKSIPHEIHSDLKDDFDRLGVKYYIEIGQLINQLKEHLPAKEKAIESTYFEDKDLAFIRKVESLSIMEQIYQSLLRFEELPVLPPNKIAKLFPFNKRDSGRSHFALYELITNNQEVVDFFDSLSLDSENNLIFKDDELIKIATPDYIEKTKSIIDTLHRNAVFHIESWGGKGRVCIHKLYVNTACDCVRCNYKQLNFCKSFNHLSNSLKETIKASLKNAYIHYQFGNFKTAFDLYEELAKRCENTNYITYFICRYNQTKLYHFISATYWLPDQKDILDKIKKINLNDELIKIPLSEEVKDVLRWVQEQKFIYQKTFAIDKILAKILDSYQLDKEGGSSSNMYVEELESQLLQVYSFLNENFIIFDNFSEFQIIINKTLEGFIASYAIQSKYSNRLTEFDDFIISVMIFHGDAEQMIKLFNRYGFTQKQIIYNSKTETGNSFLITRIKNFLNESKTIADIVSDNNSKNNYHFEDKYNRILSNLLIISAKFNLAKSNVNFIASQLILLFKNCKIIHHSVIKHLRYFINQRGNLIDLKTLRQFLEIAISYKAYHDDSLIKTIIVNIKTYHPNFKIKDSKTANLILSNYEPIKCPQCGYSHGSDMLIKFWLISNYSLKAKLKDIIITRLNFLFDKDLYFTAAFNKVIDFSIYLSNFIQCVQDAILKRPKSKHDTIPILENDNFIYFDLNRLIDLAFKFNIDIMREDIQQFTSTSPYFEWLLDMETFDYSKFEIIWVLEYPSIHYFKRMKAVSIISQKIRNELDNNYSKRLGQVYLKYFM
jgi:hypothetical protein